MQDSNDLQGFPVNPKFPPLPPAAPDPYLAPGFSGPHVPTSALGGPELPGPWLPPCFQGPAPGPTALAAPVSPEPQALGGPQFPSGPAAPLLPPVPALAGPALSPGPQAASKPRRGPSPQSRGTPRKHRQERTVYTKEQQAKLEKVFLKTRYPTFYHREILAKKLKVEEHQIQVWFKNRRAKQARNEQRKEEQLSDRQDAPRAPPAPSYPAPSWGPAAAWPMPASANWDGGDPGGPGCCPYAPVPGPFACPPVEPTCSGLGQAQSALGYSLLEAPAGAAASASASAEFPVPMEDLASAPDQAPAPASAPAQAPDQALNQASTQAQAPALAPNKEVPDDLLEDIDILALIQEDLNSTNTQLFPDLFFT
ncbi:PREDICTED: paired mesoderm homeobox protein 2-like [Dipodomys ordii]|uniref:Paired mesoderm homeobox protein 2-like n=1 Tax=Dipodomys ordii TaxID=10020 RepID=A0A1S3GGM9_DIPOR|nr:PREDICTED: paired mesoderm homeobox protein 2-like [Dipodomys ordii]